MPKASNPHPVAWVQHEMTAPLNLGNTPGVWTTVDFSSDVDSFYNGYLDKPTSSQFRALVDCSVRVYYRCRIDPSANNSGVSTRILLNGSGDVGRSHSQDGSNRANDAENNNLHALFIMNMNANDYFELQASPLEGSTVSFVPDMTILLVELIRLR